MSASAVLSLYSAADTLVAEADIAFYQWMLSIEERLAAVETRDLELTAVGTFIGRVQ